MTYQCIHASIEINLTCFSSFSCRTSVTMLIPCFLCLTCLMPILARSTLITEASSERRADESRYLPPTNPLFLLEETPSLKSHNDDRERSLPLSGTEIRIAPHKVLKPSSDEAFEITEKQYLRGDWCKTQPLKQVIQEPGCISRTIANRFCYGQCNSFFIPKQASSYNEAFKSCSFCKPFRMSYITVTLRCPGQNPTIKRKRVQRVKKCRCMAVDVP